MDAARMAAQSDPDRNYHFSRRWEGPPDLRSGGRVIPTTRSAKSKDGSNKAENNASPPRGPWVSLEEWVEKMAAGE